MQHRSCIDHRHSQWQQSRHRRADHLQLRLHRQQENLHGRPRPGRQYRRLD
jgi:hypothetical protein